MLIWNGLGILVAIIGFSAMIITQSVVNKFMAQGNFYGDHGWPKALAMAIAALGTFLLTRLRPVQSRVFTDEQTGQRVELKCQDKLFFIPSRYWVFIYLGLGVILFFA